MPFDEMTIQSLNQPQDTPGEALTRTKLIQTANSVFGYDGWNFTIEECERIPQPTDAANLLGYRVRALFEARAGDEWIRRSDYGFAESFYEDIDPDAQMPESVILREAVDDSLRRALQTFGARFGNMPPHDSAGDAPATNASATNGASTNGAAATRKPVETASSSQPALDPADGQKTAAIPNSAEIGKYFSSWLRNAKQNQPLWDDYVYSFGIEPDESKGGAHKRAILDAGIPWDVNLITNIQNHIDAATTPAGEFEDDLPW